jgi:hypothetical protein
MAERIIDIVIRGKNLTTEDFAAARKELRELEKANGDVGQSSKSLGDSFGAFAAKAAIAGAALYEVVSIAGEWIAASNAQETATAQLNAALQSQGTLTKPLSQQYADLATEFERTTGNADELLMGMEAMLVQVGDVGPKDMRAALAAATDLSAGLGVDLKTATMAVAKAFDGGGTAIGKFLPSLKNLVKDGASTEEVLAAIHERFGGQAQAQMQTYGGMMKSVANIVDNTKESMGDMIKAGLSPLVHAFLDLPSSVQSGAVALGVLAAGGTAVITAVTAVSAAIAIAAPIFGVPAASVGATALAGLGAAASAAASAFLPLAAAIAAVWAAWKIGNTETVKNGIAEWALSSDNLTARLSRAVLGIDQMTPAAAHAAVAATAAAEAARAHADAVNTSGESHERAKPAVVSYSDALSVAKAQVASFTAEQRAQIKAGDDLHQSSADITKALKAQHPEWKITEDAVKLYVDALKNSDAAGKKTAEQQKELTEFIKKTNLEWGLLGAGAFSASEKVTKAAERMAASTIANTLIQKDAQDELNDIVTQRYMTRTEFQILQINRAAYNEKLKLDETVANWKQAASAIDALAAQKRSDIFYNEDVDSADAIFNGAMTNAEMAEAKYGKVASRLGSVSEILDHLPGKFFEVAGAAARTGQAIFENLAKGDTFGAVVAGITGAATVIGKLFTDRNKQEVQKYNDEIKKVHDSLLQQYGDMEHLEAAGNRVGLSFQENWGHQGKAGLEATNTLMAQLKERTEAVDAALGRVTGGFGDVVAGMTKPWTELGKTAEEAAKVALKAYDDYQKALSDPKASEDQKTQLKETYEAAYQKSLSLHLQLEGMAVDGKQQLADLGVQAISSFGAAMLAGKTYGEAMAAIGPSLATLGESYKALGLDVEDVGLKHLILQSTVAKANPELIAAASGLGTSMQGLAQLGMLNVDTFGAMQRTGMAMYTRLQGSVGALGGDTRDALLPMQSYLQEAAAQAELLGVPLDANTQMLIEQSNELGIWKDKGKSAQDLLIEGMKAMVDKVDQLLTKMMGFSNAISGLPSQRDITINVTENVTRNVDTNDGGGGDGIDWGGPKAAGGDYWVTRPTMFLVGEAGPERATFTPNRSATVPDFGGRAAQGQSASAPVVVNNYIVNDFTGSRQVSESEFKQIQARLYTGGLQVPVRAITQRTR